MDVRCERCQTEYEVEDSILSDNGTEVQCSDCGHLFTVKRPPATLSAVAVPLAPPSAPATSAAWTLMTSLGQTHELRDLTQLHKWIIEKRVSRQDQVSQDGVSWQPLGSVAELLPFFDIVDSAERAHALDTLSALPLAPLQPPVLTPHEVRPPVAEDPRSAQPQQPSGIVLMAGSSGDSLGALPQAADIGETEMIQTGPPSRRLMKLALMVTVAAAIASAGIVWQRHHFRSAVISSSGTADEQSRPAMVVSAAAVPPTVIPAQVPTLQAQADDQAAADESAETGVDAPPAAQAGDDPAVPQTAAARGYVALNHRDYVDAIALFKEALAEKSTNGTALFGLAEAYRGAGQKTHALHTYRRYVQGLPWGPDARAARAHIRSLEAQKR